MSEEESVHPDAFLPGTSTGNNSYAGEGCSIILSLSFTSFLLLIVQSLLELFGDVM